MAILIPLVAFSASLESQVLITFEGPPLLPPASAYSVALYYESGMEFTSFGGGFGRVTPVIAFYPQNGTAYLNAASGHSLIFYSNDGSPFDLLSVDLAEYSTVVPDPTNVDLIGYGDDGSTVSTNLVSDGVIDGSGPLADFQTFYFDSRFRNLQRVEIPNSGWSLDNLAINFSRPTLSMVTSQSELTISWPASAVNFILETTSDLSLPDWEIVTNSITTTNGFYSVVISNSEPHQFFRLIKP